MLAASAVWPDAVGQARAADGSTRGGAERAETAEKERTADRAGRSEKDKTAGKDAPRGKGRKGDASDTAEKAETDGKKKPACMHCGTTCGLEPVCVCKPGTKKKPVTEYEAECEPFCVPGCGGPQWGRHGAGCTDCPAECGRCPGTVRSRKKLSKQTRDEEVAVVKRSVEYVCCRCAERAPAGCGAADPVPRPEAGEAWWRGWWREWWNCLRR